MGCASIAQRLMIPAILKLPEMFELVAIASRTKDKAQQFASSFKCEALMGYDTLLQRDDVDAVYIPLPTGLHKEWIEKALIAKKHVYAEKSIAMTAIDARSMVNKAIENNVALMEGYMFQYHTQHRLVKDLISKGEIGEIRNIRASFGFPPFPDSHNFRYDNVIGGGALKDAAGYVWRCINFLMGNNFRIKASSVKYTEEGTSLYGSAFAVDQNLVTSEISFGFDNFYQCNYEIWGSKGKLSCLRAFTPKPNDYTYICLEKAEGKSDFKIEPCNHFCKAMEEFYCLCIGTADRQKHFNDILYQAEGLDQIECLSHD